MEAKEGQDWTDIWPARSELLKNNGELQPSFLAKDNSTRYDLEKKCNLALQSGIVPQ